MPTHNKETTTTMATKTTKDVATIPDQKNAMAAYDYGDMAGEGSEGTTTDDVSIPFMNLLQPLSPQVSGDTAIDGAKPGDFLNNVTQDIISGKTGFLFQPCFRDHCFIEWVPKDNGGGFVGRHEVNSQAVLDAIAENGGSKYGELKRGSNELVETIYIYGLVLNADGTDIEGFAVLPCWSTKMKPLRAAWTQYTITKVGPIGNKRTPPLYSMRWKITSKGDKNKKGQPFFNYVIDPKALPLLNPTIDTDRVLLGEGQAFYQQIKSGAKKADLAAQTAAREPGVDAGDTDTPF